MRDFAALSCCILLLIFGCADAVAPVATLPSVPALSAFADLAEVLSPAEPRQIADQINENERKTGVQLTVVAINAGDPQALADELAASLAPADGPVVVTVTHVDGRFAVAASGGAADRVRGVSAEIGPMIRERALNARMAEALAIGLRRASRAAVMPTIHQVVFNPALLPKLEPQADVVERLALLCAAHEFSADLDAIYRLTLDPVEALLVVAGDETRPESVRLRAFDLLAFMPDPRVHLVYSRAIHYDGAPRLRHRAVQGFARAWPDQALVEVGGLVALAGDPQIRLTAAAAVLKFCGPEGRRIVQEAATVEAEPWVREKFLDYLKRSRPAGEF